MQAKGPKVNQKETMNKEFFRSRFETLGKMGVQAIAWQPF